MSAHQTSGEEEGVIRFAYGLQEPDGDIATPARLAEFNAWREVLRRMRMIGQDPGRYGGFGFGNLSARDPQRPDEFLITASQTGATPLLADRDLVRVTDSDPARMWVDARGRQPPSSETLTHAALYRADPGVNWVFHGHTPELWARAADLGLPATAADVDYGSVAMATATAELLQQYRERPLVFVTLGHQDGVFACAAHAAAGAAALIEAWTQAWALDRVAETP